MPLTSDAKVFEVDGFWTPPEGLHSFEVIVRGGGGGGSSGDRSSSSWSNFSYDAEGNPVYVSGSSARWWPGVGGGGGGLTMSRGLIRVEEIAGSGPIPITIGQGGTGAWGDPTYPSFAPGGNGTASTFGDIYYAGGGLGGGRVEHSGVTGYQYGGPGGYAPTRGGLGATYLRTNADSINETSTLAGGGGGGRGLGRYETDGDQYGNTTTTIYEWSKGGASGANPPIEGNGFHVPGRPLHWEYLQSGCGGNGGGANGGFPSGGGGGGNAIPVSGGRTSGGNGAPGCVTVIEHFMIY